VHVSVTGQTGITATPATTSAPRGTRCRYLQLPTNLASVFAPVLSVPSERSP
jgi:hypothetical protein